LFGDGTTRGRADVLKWLSLLNSDVHPAFKPIFAPTRYHPDASQLKTVADMARTSVRAYLERIDGRMKGRAWIADRRSVADPYLFVMLRWAVKLHIDTKGLDNLASFFDRMLADPGVRAAILAEEGNVDSKARLVA
jgi:glutathione S-transferase